MSTKNLFIIHIPKTAGTTLRSIALQQYSPTDICGIYSEDEFIDEAAFRALPAEDKERYSVFMGHVDFGFREAIPGNRPLACMTVVRDPEARCRSQYSHVMNHLLPGSELSFSELVLNHQDSWCLSMPATFDNTQVRYLAPVDHAEVPFGQCTREHLEQAKNNLRQYFDVVGTSERFVETLFLAHKAFGWQPLAYRNENLSADKPRRDLNHITEDDRALIRELNALDVELYEFARALMQEQLEAHGPDWQAQVAAFQKSQDEAWRRAATSFNPKRYLEANPDVRTAGLEPLQHFLMYGQFEGRPGTPPLSGQALRNTRACTAPWIAPATIGAPRHLCPRITLPADPGKAREQLISVRYGLMTGVLARECAGCPIAPPMPLPRYLAQLGLKRLNILAR